MQLHTVAMPTKPKRPRDPNQLAKLITGIATGDEKDSDPNDGKDLAAVARGRKGGLKGGKNRMAALTDSERSKLGKQAADSRWKKGVPSQDGTPTKGQLNKTS